MFPTLFLSTGWSGPARPGVLPFEGAHSRLKPTCGASSGSHVRMTNTPFFACNGMRPWTPAAAFLTKATPGHLPGNMRGSIAVKAHNVAFVNHSGHVMQGLADLGPLKFHSAQDIVTAMLLGADFHSRFTKRSNFSPPRPTYRCSFKEPFEGLGHSAVFTNDSPAPEPMVNAPYRPHFPSAPVTLSSVDNVTVQLHFVRLAFSIAGDVVMADFSTHMSIVFCPT